MITILCHNIIHHLFFGRYSLREPHFNSTETALIRYVPPPNGG